MKKLLIVMVCVVLILGAAFSQTLQIPLIGSKAPSFTATTTNGTITFPDDKGKKWEILFSH
jgi:peroxiredoxin (alkyl hydroperoxide reductase subunit C)